MPSLNERFGRGGRRRVAALRPHSMMTGYSYPLRRAIRLFDDRVAPTGTAVAVGRTTPHILAMRIS